ncbi:methionyl-tRNA formyltransferase [Mesoplasma seiffertii]|uniref:methionyl-tRNA formyltransferase n=1 Tax=Mesoplasma seiffertii TaxID=28224 RepID=UPI0004796736|nr:methionyl-tRNA formyltransferase [Mesoplasma seiffertii]
MIKNLRVVFCGTPQIGADILAALIEMPNVEVVKVISQPDKFVGRKKVLTPTVVKQLALQHDIPVIQPIKIGEAYEEIKSTNPDFIVTCAYGQFIPTKILEIPKIDAINIHGSLLPKYRGGAPIQYAIKNGETETGISIMKMVKKMDAGDYYVQEAIAIEPDDTSGTMFQKLGVLGARMIKKYLFKIANQEIQPIAQNEAEVTFSKNISTSEEMIDWNQTANQINNHIRALAPTPIAHTYLKSERYKIKSARLLRDDEFFATTLNIKKPGEIVAMDKEGIIIHTNEGFLKILEIQRPGKSMINAGLYFTNRLTDLRIGDVFGETMI